MIPYYTDTNKMDFNRVKLIHESTFRHMSASGFSTSILCGGIGSDGGNNGTSIDALVRRPLLLGVPPVVFLPPLLERFRPRFMVIT